MENNTTIDTSESENKTNQGESSDEFEKQCELLLSRITVNYREQRNEIKNLIKLHKKEVKNIKNNKNKNKKKTGIMKPGNVPDKLADFVGIAKGTKMSRPDLTNLISSEFERRGLYHKKDRRIIIPDDDVMKLFNLSKEAQKSNDPKDENGLNFFNLQKHIARIYDESNNTTLSLTA